MDREEFEKQQLGNRPTSAYEGRTQPSTENLPGPGPFDSPESHERNSAEPAQHRASSEETHEEGRREAGGDQGQAEHGE